jgi:cellulose synthase/poly-beta-1,6-N-acetylglucosamine synthase-like glycosyltransferase
VRLQRHLHEQKIEAGVVFIPDPVAWTEVPVTVSVLGRQRERWHRGLIATMVQHRSLIFNPSYGATGMIAMPYFLFGELLAPVVETAGLLISVVGMAFGLLEPRYALAFFVVAYLYGVVLSLAAIIMESVSFHRYERRRDTLRLIWFAIIEPFGYRQLTVWFRLKAFWRYFRGDHSWGRMKREGFGRPAARSTGPRLTPAAVPAVVSK